MVTLRDWLSDDSAAVAEVMYRSVHEAAAGPYSPQQRQAWMPARPDAEAIRERALDGRRTLVACDERGAVVGYIDLEPDGHIDHLFCAPEAVGRGVGAQLYDAVEALAVHQGIRRLFVEASEQARRLFEKKGFTVDERREWEL